MTDKSFQSGNEFGVSLNYKVPSLILCFKKILSGVLIFNFLALN